jgi:hypothetical protein
MVDAVSTCEKSCLAGRPRVYLEWGVLAAAHNWRASTTTKFEHRLNVSLRRPLENFRVKGIVIIVFGPLTVKAFLMEQIDALSGSRGRHCIARTS